MLINKVTLLGHKDHGKSTLIGSLLIATKSVTEQRINDAKKTSKQLGRQFEPGYILDSFQEERENEMTIDTTRAQIKYRDAAFEFIDVPGHEELIKNMMTGASYASFAVLLVSAKPDEGIRDQTKRHLFLAKMMGIKKILIAVNKMDTVKYDKARFGQIKTELSEFLEKIGFDSKSLEFIPISAYNQDNLVTKSKNIKWYTGKNLLDTMYSLAKTNDSARDSKLRVVMQGYLAGDEKKSIGKVITGTIKSGENLILVPEEKAYKIKSLFVKGKKAKSAKFGENIAIETDKKLPAQVRGSVLYRKGDEPALSETLDSLIFLTEKLGSNASIKFNGLDVPATIEIINGFNVVTGEDEKTKKIAPLSAAKARINLGIAIPAEHFKSNAQLGRFVIYSGKTFAGIGIVN